MTRTTGPKEPGAGALRTRGPLGGYLHTVHVLLEESKSVMKSGRRAFGGCGVGWGGALVYCWRACIYFMPLQIVGKGRADRGGVIRERESLPQRAALLRYSKPSESW